MTGGLAASSILPRDMNQRQWAEWARAQNALAAPGGGVGGVRTFTPTWTGFSVNPSEDWSYIDLGGAVILFNTKATEQVGTSNAFTFTVTNLPEQIRPAQQRWVPCLVVNNDFTISGSVLIDNAGLVQFHAGAVDTSVVPAGVLAYHADGFVNSAHKGVPAGWLVIYPK